MRGEGDQIDLAHKVVATLSLTQTPLAPPNVSPAAPAIDWEPAEKIIGRTGHRQGAMIQFTFRGQSQSRSMAARSRHRWEPHIPLIWKHLVGK